MPMIQTPVLDIGFEESGDTGGFPIILLHGLPYDVRTWDETVPPLADAGYRVLVPYRGRPPRISGNDCYHFLRLATSPR